MKVGKLVWVKMDKVEGGGGGAYFWYDGLD